jgi:hypothetical protein
MGTVVPLVMTVLATLTAQAHPTTTLARPSGVY